MKILLLVSVLTIVSFAQNIITETQIAAWEQFNNQYNKQWKIKWNSETGSPSSIYSYKTHIYSSDLVSASKLFLKEVSGVFLIDEDLSNLDLQKQNQFTDFNQISFSQNFNGIPVYNSDISITFNKENKIIFVCANFFNGINIKNELVLTENQAINIVSSITGIVEIEHYDAKVMVYSDEDGALLIWKVFVRSNSGEMYQVIIDAETGKVLELNDLIPKTVTGQVNYYPIDPINSSLLLNQSAYRLDGTGYLRGTYANVLSDITTRAYHKYHNFTYSTTDDHFNEGNIYWHIDNIAHNYYYTILQYQMTQIDAIINSTSGGSYDQYEDIIYCGALVDTTSPDIENHYRCFSRKDDQIYHEYSHAVVMRIGLNYNTAEVMARNEGYADYFACSFTNDPVYGEWYAFDAPHMRIVSNSSSTFSYKNWNSISYYNDYNGVQHRNGMIWSGACWDLRTALGQTVADKIILGGVQEVNGSYDFESAMNGIISADYDLYSGTHVCTIETIFNNRSILNPSAPIGLTISGSLGQNPTVSWTRSNEPDVIGYEVNRSFNGGSYTLIQTINKSYVTSYTDPNSTIGSSGDPIVCYKVKAKDKYGNSSVLSDAVCAYDGGINKEKSGEDSEFIKEYKLFEGFPNPFNPSTNIKISIPEKSNVILEVYNCLGKKVALLENKILESGNYVYMFSVNNLPSGVYYIRLSATSTINNAVYAETNKIVLLK